MARCSVLLVVLLFPALAFAHAVLERADPPIGGKVSTAPPVLTLWFSERVEPRFTQVQVLNASGHTLSAGEPHGAADDARKIIIGLPKLPPGTYTVIWRATSVDTHRTNGRYRFSVGP